MKKFVVVPYDSNWAALFEIEQNRVMAALGEILVSVHHIGSTSIPGIYAKPVIDMLAEATSIEEMDSHASAMIRIGYEVMGEFGIPTRRYFRKDVEGIRTFQIHAFQVSSPEIDRHIKFRDYLIAHPVEAREYSDLKRQLVRQHSGSQDEYIEGKDGFIKEIDRKASLWRI